MKRYDSVQNRCSRYVDEAADQVPALLPDLMRAGVTALKIEGRQRSRAYVRSVVAAIRIAVDAILAGENPEIAGLLALTEGHRETQGAFQGKTWR